MSRVATPLTFGRRCIPASGLAPRLHVPDMRARRALLAGRIGALDVHWISDSRH